MNHFKKLFFVLNFGMVCAVSVVYAQSVSFDSSNSTQTNSTSSLEFGFSNQTTPISFGHVIPYHPRDPMAYYAEKQQIDSQVIFSYPAHFWIKSFNKWKSFSSPVNIISTGFEGLNVTQGGNFDPPDVQIAIGPGNVFEMVNLKGQTYDRQGNLNNTVNLATLFNFNGVDHLSDPNIIYDSQSGRWFASLLDVDNDTVGIVVSKTSDPSINNWYIHHEKYDTQTRSECPDQPKIGISDNKFVVSTNDFGGPSAGNCVLNTQNDGAEYRVFNKTQMITGTFNRIFQRGPTISEFAVTPVQSMSPTSNLYMVSDGAVSSTKQITIFNLTGTSSVTLNTKTITLKTNILTPADAKQPITTTLLDTGDTRILNAIWFKGKLWFSLNDGCKPTGDSLTRSCARFIQINTNTTKVTQDFDVNSTGNYYYYPALTLDGTGGMGTVIGVSSSDSDNNIYPSLQVTGQSPPDPSNSTKQLTYLKVGSQYDDTPDGPSFTARYGDYFGAALDPSNSTRIWIAGEYNKIPPSHNQNIPTWSTFIGSISFDCLPPTSGNWVVTASCTLAKSSTVPANVTVQTSALLTIQNATYLSIDFTHNHLLVNPSGGVYIAPGGKIT